VHHRAQILDVAQLVDVELSEAVAQTGRQILYTITNAMVSD
jgi:hypothetical protein